MGSNTDFTGVMEFGVPMTQDDLALINTYLGEDVRDHPEWGSTPKEFYFIDLRLTKDLKGVEWDGSEKTRF